MNTVYSISVVCVYKPGPGYKCNSLTGAKFKLKTDRENESLLLYDRIMFAVVDHHDTFTNAPSSGRDTPSSSESDPELTTAVIPSLIKPPSLMEQQLYVWNDSFEVSRHRVYCDYLLRRTEQSIDV